MVQERKVYHSIPDAQQLFRKVETETRPTGILASSLVSSSFFQMVIVELVCPCSEHFSGLSVSLPCQTMMVICDVFSFCQSISLFISSTPLSPLPPTVWRNFTCQNFYAKLSIEKLLAKASSKSTLNYGRRIHDTQVCVPLFVPWYYADCSQLCVSVFSTSA